MGSYQSGFQTNENTVSEYSSPSSADWITAHATASELAIVEVERLWFRFQQLGCNDRGILTAEVFRDPAIAQDVFMKNILLTFQSSNAEITFQTFLNAMKWAETSDLEDRIRGIYRLINAGQPIQRDLLVKVLKRTYPRDGEDDIQRIADVFMERIDTRRQGYLDEEQFVQTVLSMPRTSIVPVLDFNIIPTDINAEAHRAFTSQSNKTQIEDSSRQIPSDAVLKKIAERISSRDWAILSNKLDYTATEITQFEARNPDEPKEQVYAMLADWKVREGPIAYCGTLERALRNSGMNDVAMLLHP